MIVMDVNLWAVLVAGIATMVVGFLWYSPMLFARPWMVAMGYDPDDKAILETEIGSVLRPVEFIFNSSGFLICQSASG